MEYYKMISMLMIGMTLFSDCVSGVPQQAGSETCECGYVKRLRPPCQRPLQDGHADQRIASIHVFNTMAILYAVSGSDQLHQKRSDDRCGEYPQHSDHSGDHVSETAFCHRCLSWHCQ